ncbi:MAG: glycerol-3-phosphate 1-O-acyltransferase PlsB [Xanthomonadales bacterium]|jgi:glycerol-3-phosphate O-acyltransferase|nr:glycerol-3-phosphate 1-O-acyltransferase PlsB [Xanthomonadales bacterium]
MNTDTPQNPDPVPAAPTAAPGHRRKPRWWLRLLSWVTDPLLKVRTVSQATELPFDPQKPVIYVLEEGGLSNLLILDRACREAGWPSPAESIRFGERHRVRRWIWLYRVRSRWSLSPRRETRTDRFQQLLTTLHLEDAHDAQLVPISVFIGRGPNTKPGWFKELIAEHWASVSRLRRFVSILFNGRSVLVRADKPIRVGDLLRQPVNLQKSGHSGTRLFRFVFHRARTAVIGPDLSHRRRWIDTILARPAVREAIARDAGPKGRVDSSTRKARHYLWEIAADYSYPVIRSLSLILGWFWNQIYSGVRVNHFDTVAEVASNREVIYVPCHRSHMDYLLLSYLLYRNGLVPPHIAAGVNLNLPVVGSILRRGGAFFMRRSFRSNPLYATVFREYLGALLQNNFSIEYFIEGGRSRSGRLLSPKGGMLSMTVKSYLYAPQRKVVFQPVYIGYEKLIEGKSYLGELSGRPKEKESLLGLIRSFAVLRNRYGHVTVNFGEPIELDELLLQQDPNWRALKGDDEAKPNWLNPLIAELGDRILGRINQAADVNPVNLLAVVLLGTPRLSIGEDDLARLIDLARQIVELGGYSRRVTMSPMSAAEVIRHGEELGWIRRIKHPLGDVLTASGDEGVLLSYFRNNVLHLFVTASWVAVCFLAGKRLSRQAVVSLGQSVYPFLKNELFLPWTAEAFAEQIERTVDLLVQQQVLALDAEGKTLLPPAEGTDAYFAIRVLAHSTLQTVQRYYLVVSLLTRSGSGTLSAGELENLCVLAAQRIMMLQEHSGPEFCDRGLFRTFIGMLKSEGLVMMNAEAKLDFTPALNKIASDAKLLLSRELRHSIHKMSSDVQAAQLPPADGKQDAA